MNKQQVLEVKTIIIKEPKFIAEEDKLMVTICHDEAKFKTIDKTINETLKLETL